MADPDVTNEKLAELSAAATPGPGTCIRDAPGLCCWHIFKSEDGIYGPEPADEDDGEPILINSPEMFKENAEFIAACVNFMCQPILGGAFFAIKYVVRKDNGCVELTHVAHRDGLEWATNFVNSSTRAPAAISVLRWQMANPVQRQKGGVISLRQRAHQYEYLGGQGVFNCAIEVCRTTEVTVPSTKPDPTLHDNGRPFDVATRDRHIHGNGIATALNRETRHA